MSTAARSYLTVFEIDQLFQKWARRISTQIEKRRKTMATQLTRKAMDVKSLQAVTDEKFVKEAKALLGYDLLEDALALRKTAEILDKLGIQPFDAAKVEAYKKEQAEGLYSRKQKTDRWGSVRTTTTRGEWQTYNLRGYKREVPAFALLRAAEIQKEMNKGKIGGKFFIDELRIKTTRSRRERPIVDPFMVLQVGETKMYVDVWNEPKFEGRRVK
jgi:hypothetical protein